MTTSESAELARLGYEAAVAHINAADGREDRAKRKAEVFHVIYGNDAARASFAAQLGLEGEGPGK